MSDIKLLNNELLLNVDNEIYLQHDDMIYKKLIKK